MKKTLTTIILLAGIALNVFAQQEIPMFFDNDLMLQTDASSQVAYSPDGSKIATVFGKGKIAIWDATTGREITRITGHGDKGISDIVFSPNGRQLVSWSGRDSSIKIWDAVSGVLLRSISQTGVNDVSFSPDGSRIAGTYSESGRHGIKIWNTANGSEIRTLVGHTDLIWSVRYSPDGNNILTVSDDCSIRIWDAGNGQTLRTISGNNELFFAKTVFSPNGRYIATLVISENDTIRIYNTSNGQELRSIPFRLINNNLMYSLDGRQLLVNADDGKGNPIIKIYDPDTGRELRSFNNGDRAVAFSPDGRRILTASTSFTLKLDDKDYGASYATLLDATTGKVTGTIGYGPLNVGARAYADMQIARFLADTAAVNRHEAVLKYITDRGNATRAEIETYYRNGIRGLVSAVVDEEFGKPGEGGIVPAQVYADWEKWGMVKDSNGKAVNGVALIKQVLGDFFINPTEANYIRVRGIIARILEQGATSYVYAIDKAFADTITSISPEFMSNIKNSWGNGAQGIYAAARQPNDPAFRIFEIPYTAGRWVTPECQAPVTGTSPPTPPNCVKMTQFRIKRALTA